MTGSRDTLLETLRSLDHGSLLVVTGAGISLASGIPTFRGTDPGAIWKHDVTEMATFAFFSTEPVESWRWYLRRFDTLVSAQPNAAHFALAELERWQTARGGELLLVTQNIDTLHEQAGSRRLVKVHGSSDRLRCSAMGCRLGAPRGSMLRSQAPIDAFIAEPTAANLPRCPECAAVLRPHVLWFDELYDEHLDYQWHRVQAAAASADAVLFVGTSFSVGVTDLIHQLAASRGAALFSIDPGATPPPYRSVAALRELAEELLPAMVDALRG
jgi:NAD-dependent deacetylase